MFKIVFFFVRLNESSRSQISKILTLNFQKILYKQYFNHKTHLNRCQIQKIHEKLHISMYITHIDHRSGAPWGPHDREGGKKFSRQSRENFFPGKGPHGGAPWGPHGREGDRPTDRATDRPNDRTTDRTKVL